MLRKLIIFAITSGLAKKAYDMYMNRPRAVVTSQRAPRRPTHKRATTVAPSADAGLES